MDQCRRFITNIWGIIMDIYAYTYDTFVIFTENLNLLHIGNKDLIVNDILDF